MQPAPAPAFNIRCVAHGIVLFAFQQSLFTHCTAGFAGRNSSITHPRIIDNGDFQFPFASMFNMSFRTPAPVFDF